MKAKILIIEDNEDMGFTLANVLNKQGYETFSATTGEEGIEIVRRELIDLVLSDLKLPKMSGLDVMSEIKSIDDDIVIGTAWQTVQCIRIVILDVQHRRFQCFEQVVHAVTIIIDTVIMIIPATQAATHSDIQ